jgi:hypothetical protein
MENQSLESKLIESYYNSIFLNLQKISAKIFVRILEVKTNEKKK